MKYLMNRSFYRDAKSNKLDDDYIHEVLDDISKGRAKSLGSKMYKIRAAKKGKGKSSGFRNIFFWKKNERVVFCILFGKNERENLTADDMKALRVLSYEYDRLTNVEIEIGIKARLFREVQYGKSG